MRSPATPVDEARRLAALHTLGLLDTDAEERFDRLTRLARRLFDVPIALVSLVDRDRQWFKSCIGFDTRQTSRDVSFCGHTILSDEILVVTDALADLRFADNPLVAGDAGIRFYAGCPLAGPDGSKLGSLCLIDRVPRAFGDEERRTLRDLARLVEQEIASARMATLDPATGLSNRRGFLELGQTALAVCARSERHAALMLVEPAADAGAEAPAGDEAVTTLANLLMQGHRDSDVVGRVGDTTLAILMTHCDVAGTGVPIERLRKAVARHNRARRDAAPLAFRATVIGYEPIRHASVKALLDDATAKLQAVHTAERAA